MPCISLDPAQSPNSMSGVVTTRRAACTGLMKYSQVLNPKYWNAAAERPIRQSISQGRPALCLQEQASSMVNVAINICCKADCEGDVSAVVKASADKTGCDWPQSS